MANGKKGVYQCHGSRPGWAQSQPLSQVRRLPSLLTFCQSHQVNIVQGCVFRPLVDHLYWYHNQYWRPESWAQNKPSSATPRDLRQTCVGDERLTVFEKTSTYLLLSSLSLTSLGHRSPEILAKLCNRGPAGSATDVCSLLEI